MTTLLLKGFGISLVMMLFLSFPAVASPEDEGTTPIANSDILSQESKISDVYETLNAVSDDSYEPNNSQGEAANISERSNHNLVLLNEDWFRLYANSDTSKIKANVYFSHSDSDIDIKLYNSNGSLVASSRSTTDNESIDVSISGGSAYYLRVLSYNATAAYYTLWWDDYTTEVVTPPTTTTSSGSSSSDSGCQLGSSSVTSSLPVILLLPIFILIRLRKLNVV